MQILIKLIITIFFFYLTCLIWGKDIDIKMLRPDRFLKSKAEEMISKIPSREKDAIYQNDKIVAKVKDGKFEKRGEEIYFDQLEYSKELNIEKEFEFQKYILKIKHIETLIGLLASEPHKGRILQKVNCKIINKK